MSIEFFLITKWKRIEQRKLRQKQHSKHTHQISPQFSNKINEGETTTTINQSRCNFDDTPTPPFHHRHHHRRRRSPYSTQNGSKQYAFFARSFARFQMGKCLKMILCIHKFCALLNSFQSFAFMAARWFSVKYIIEN